MLAGRTSLIVKYKKINNLNKRQLAGRPKK